MTGSSPYRLDQTKHMHCSFYWFQTYCGWNYICDKIFLMHSMGSRYIACHLVKQPSWWIKIAGLGEWIFAKCRGKSAYKCDLSPSPSHLIREVLCPFGYPPFVAQRTLLAHLSQKIRTVPASLYINLFVLFFSSNVSYKKYGSGFMILHTAMVPRLADYGCALSLLVFP